MKSILILLSVLVLLAACSARNNVPFDNGAQNDNQELARAEDPSPDDSETGSQDGKNPQNTVEPPEPGEKPEAEPEKPKEVVPLVTFIELGAESCIPCRMMQPVMRNIQLEYEGLVAVVFYDLYKERWAGQEYNVRVMPTQVFLDMEGREFFRHEGFYPQEEIEKMLAEKIGVTKPR
jgi:thioredoxin 1